MPESRPLRVFLCHASQDKPKVRELYKRLKSKDWIEPWLDEEKLLPGMDWDLEIYKALRDADAILICLSKESIAKEGYVQKEFKRALNFAEEKPEGAIYIIPLRLDECNPPVRFQQWQWLDYFVESSHDKLLQSLGLRAKGLDLQPSAKPVASPLAAPGIDDDLDLYRFVQIPATPELPYSFSVGKYPVTNSQYERFLNAPDYATESYWRGFLKFNEDCIQIGRWRNEGGERLKEKMGKSKNPPLPLYWGDENFGSANPENPVVGITWFEANAYCNWLLRHWNELAESRANLGLHPHLIRLPLDAEWTIAAGGETPKNRYPWDLSGKETTDEKEIVRRANVSESHIGHTTPVNAYLRGVSPHGVMDMAGNVWEWQANYQNMKEGLLGLRGGSWLLIRDFARVSVRNAIRPYLWDSFIGFRVACLPSERS